MPQPSPYWGDEPIWYEQAEPAQSDDGCARRASGSRTRSARTRIRLSARKDRAIRPRSCSRLHESGRQLSCTTRRRSSSRSSTPASARTTCSFPRTQTTRSGSAAELGGRQVLGWFNTKLYDADQGCGEVAGLDAVHPSTATATASGMRMSNPMQPADPTKDRRIQGGMLRGDSEPGRWLDLGGRAGRARFHHSRESGVRTRRRRLWRKSTSRRSTSKVTGEGYRSARNRHRSQRRRVDRAGGQQPPGELRPPQVQGPQRSDRDGAALSRRLDAVS